MLSCVFITCRVWWSPSSHKVIFGETLFPPVKLRAPLMSLAAETWKFPRFCNDLVTGDALDLSSSSSTSFLELWSFYFTSYIGCRLLENKPLWHSKVYLEFIEIISSINGGHGVCRLFCNTVLYLYGQSGPFFLKHKCENIQYYF